jgi:hypothetical protein
MRFGWSGGECAVEDENSRQTAYIERVVDWINHGSDSAQILAT